MGDCGKMARASGDYAIIVSQDAEKGISRIRLPSGSKKTINSNARARAVVMHGASYANPVILKSQGYLGRSQGCPAIPEALKEEIIKVIKGKSCLFIYHPSRSYEITSKLVA